MKLLPAIALIMITLQAAAQQSKLDPVTVVSTVSSLRVSETGRNIIVIPGSTFEQLPVHSIDELLRYIPGVEVQMRGPMGAQSDIVMRGGTFQQTLILIDGVRLNDPNTGHFTSYIPVAPHEIERIEVLKGAGSAIYGSEAVGGVIHIITKTFAAKFQKEISDITAAVVAGEYDLVKLLAGLSVETKGTAISAGVLAVTTGGQPQRGISGYAYNYTSSLSVKQILYKGLTLALRGSYDARKFAAQNFYTNFISDTAKERIKMLWTQGSLEYVVKNNKFRIDAGYKKLTDHFMFNANSAANESISNLWQVLGTYERKFSETNVLTTGGQFIDKGISSNDRGDHNVKLFAIFGAWSKSFQKFTMNPAMRLEYNEISKLALVPQINLSYRPKSWQLRASAGKTIRDADFTERYNNYNKSLVTSGRIGNPDLKVERSFSYEAGADHYIGESLKLSATFFDRDHSDLIDYVVTPYNEMPRKVNLVPGGSYALAKNISKLRTRGIEIDAQVSKKWEEKLLITNIGFTWLESKGTQSSYYILSHAKLLANFSASYYSKVFSFALAGLYKLREPQSASNIKAEVSKDYFTLGAKVEAKVVKEYFQIYAQVDNIFNKNYQDILGSQMPGRWMSAGVRLRMGE